MVAMKVDQKDMNMVAYLVASKVEIMVDEMVDWTAELMVEGTGMRMVASLDI